MSILGNDSTVAFSPCNQSNGGWLPMLVAMRDLSMSEAEVQRLIFTHVLGMRVNAQGQMEVKQTDVAALVATQKRQQQAQATKAATPPKPVLTPTQRAAKAAKKAQQKAIKRAKKAARVTRKAVQPAHQPPKASKAVNSRIVTLSGRHLAAAPALSGPSVRALEPTQAEREALQENIRRLNAQLVAEQQRNPLG